MPNVCEACRRSVFTVLCIVHTTSTIWWPSRLAKTSNIQVGENRLAHSTRRIYSVASLACRFHRCNACINSSKRRVETSFMGVSATTRFVSPRKSKFNLARGMNIFMKCVRLVSFPAKLVSPFKIRRSSTHPLPSAPCSLTSCANEYCHPADQLDSLWILSS